MSQDPPIHLPVRPMYLLRGGHLSPKFIPSQQLAIASYVDSALLWPGGGSINKGRRERYAEEVGHAYNNLHACISAMHLLVCHVASQLAMAIHWTVAAAHMHAAVVLLIKTCEG